MPEDLRQSPRKFLKTRAIFVVEAGAPLMAHTTDISASGVALVVAQPAPVGQVAQLRFDLLVEGKSTPILAKTQVQYCIFSNGEFKVGLKFVGLDLVAVKALARYLK